MRIMRFWLVLGLVAATTACGSDERAPSTTNGATTDSASTTTDVPTSVDPTSTDRDPTTSPVPPDTTSTTTPGPPQPNSPATSTPTTSTPPTSAVPSEVDVKVYLLRDERLVIAHRQVAGPAILGGALTELFAGPTPAERAAGLTSTVPAGTELLGLDLAAGIATVDLSSAFASGGGSLSMMARVAQLVFTATQFENSDSVVLWIDGAAIESLGGEGIMLDGPQARMDVERSISGSVIIDVPVFGTTVTSPFTVTGEGDVFEAQFPIEVWSGGWGTGQQIGGVAPVTAGAWGEWAEFEATITLDAPAGPIELVAYDEGGCGTDPECPEIIRTIVPLIFTG
jgi:hypothetical protein